MDILYPQCAGLDVHKKNVTACRVWRDAKGQRVSQTRTFATMTGDILALSDWLQEVGCTHVAMESTGVYWQPIWNLLEPNFELLLINPQHVQMVPGRKTDTKDAEWIAQLLELGLLRASFVPAAPQRALRELTRARATFIRQRAQLENRIQKVLESANIKLGAVASDVLGVSGRAMLEAMAAGESEAGKLADLAVGRLRSKRGELMLALHGRIQPHHRLILRQLLTQVKSLDQSIAVFDDEIGTQCVPFEGAVERLDTITGVGRATAELILSEIGPDMSKFATAGHLCAWAGVAPGNKESGGKRLSGRTRKANRSLRSGLVQAAQAAGRSKNTYLSALYRRIAARRGKKRAIIAVAHAILQAVYYMLTRCEEYRERGADYFDQLRPKMTATRLVKRLQTLGYIVNLSADPTQLAAQ